MKKHVKLAKEIEKIIDTADKAILRMNIRQILDKHAPVEKPFPKFMICTHDYCDTGCLVYFTKPRKGIVIKQSDVKPNSNNGYESSDWVMYHFKDCEIEVKVKGES